MWHSNDASFDDDWGDVGRGRGSLWEEVEGVLWGVSGCYLHDWERERRGKERTRRSDVQAEKREK
jgi:hypothetical protein